MTLLDALVPRQEPVAMVAPEKPKRRWSRRKRISRQEREAARDKLTAELRMQIAERSARMTAEQQALREKSSVLPEGVKVVSG